MGIQIDNLSDFPIDPAESAQVMQSMRDAIVRLQRTVADNFAPARQTRDFPWYGLRLIRITSYSGLGSGWYSGRLQTRKKNTSLDPTVDVALANVYADEYNADDCYCIDVNASGFPATTHLLKNAGTAFVWGQYADQSLAVPAPDSITAAKQPRPVFTITAVPLGIIFAVNLTQTGGSNGNASTSATWTYTAKTLDNSTTLGTVLSPQKSRPHGTMTAATLGSGYYNSSNAFTLYEALETPGTGTC
jgi:hypothetical protein